MHPRPSARAFVLFAVLAACGKPVYIVRLPHAGTGWQQGTTLPPQIIGACNPLDAETQSACVYTETSCTEGIHSIKLSVLPQQKAELVVTCLATVPVDEGGL